MRCIEIFVRTHHTRIVIMININMRCIEMPLLAVMLVGGTGLTLT